MKNMRFLTMLTLFLVILATFMYGQNEIFRSKWVGTSVDGFLCPVGEFVDSFVASTSGEWQVLTAWSATGSNDIFRTKLAGMGVQTFKPSPGGHINAFTTSTVGEYIHLVAWSSTGESESIIRSKLAGTGAQDFTAPVGEYITQIVGRDSTDGYVYLVIGATALGIFELTEFTAVAKKQYVLLKWRTEAEFESFQWLVQRKGMDGEYETIGLLDAQGHSSKPTDYQFKDKGITLGEKYFYRLIELDLYGEETIFGPLFVDLSTRDLIPRRLYIAQNVPNPFERMTSVKFGIPLANKDDAARLVVYDVTGRVVKTLLSGRLEPGYYHVSWHGKNDIGKEVGAGVYFCRLSIGSKNLTKKMIYVK